MLAKLRLDQTKVYEKHIALEEISIMLVSFVNGYPHHLAIGAEQGDIDKWDDLVIQTTTGGCIHVQAKRQTTDFPSGEIIRDKYIRGDRKGVLRDLSPFDKTLKSLGERISKNESDLSDLQKEFWLELPESLIEIKKDLCIRHLRELCEGKIKSVTTSNYLVALAEVDSDAKNIFQWLTTWCDFKDWEHILKAFKILKTKTSGMEVDIVGRVDNNLNKIFKSTEIERVRLLILAYLDENSTYAGVIKPRQLLYLLKDYLRPNIPRWTQFQADGANWNISGIHDLENNQDIERSSIVVPALWQFKNNNTRYLKIDGECNESCEVATSLIRLSLHHQGSFNTFCNEKSSWEYSIKTKTGGTLGVTANDLNDSRILDNLEPSLPSEVREVTTLDEQEAQAKELHDEMYNVTFKLIDTDINEKIRGMGAGDLRTEVENRWRTWKPLLEINIEEQRKFFSRILHPNAEGGFISGELRVGPKTVSLLKEAIFLLLVVSVCLSDDDNENSWESVTNKLKMTSIGLAYWSGPANESRKTVVEIDDEDGLSKLLENERSQIIIISKSGVSDSELFKDGISGEISKVKLLTHPSYPRLLITQDLIFKRILKKGNISDLTAYFQSKLDDYQDVMSSAIDNVVDMKVGV